MQSSILFPSEKKGCIQFIILFVTVVVIVVASIIVYTNVFIGLNNRIDQLDASNQFIITDFPKKYIVPWEALTPAKDQGKRGLCWAFATVGFLEASYNSEAKRYHGLANDTYVSFSEQLIGINMLETCKGSNDSHCTNGMRKNSTSDGLPEWLYYFREKNQDWALPDSLCPYQKEEENWDKCDNREESMKKNPIRFKVNSIETAYSIAEIKNLLMKTELPLTWSHAVFNKVFTVKCSRLTNPESNDDCKNKRIPCGDDYCYEIQVSSYDNNGIFDMTGQTYITGGHSMTLVGYNDDFRINRNAQHRKINEYSQGGFIVKNSWGTTGHSAGYFMSNHSTVQEDSLCPNMGAYTSWIPADLKCMQQSFNLTECSSGFYRIVRLKKHDGATVLKCTDNAKKEEYANAFGVDICAKPENKGKELRFVLQSESTSQPLWSSGKQVKMRYKEGDKGEAQYYMMYWEEGKENDVKELITEVTTYQELEKLFTPIDMVENSKYCGYYFIPYDVFKFSNGRYFNFGDDTPAFSSFNITWEPQSFVDKKKKDYDYTAIEEMIKSHKFAPLHFVGPYLTPEEIPQM